MTLTRHCPFCNKTIWLEWYAEEGGLEVGCDCSAYREHYHCRKTSCSNMKVDGSDYCWEHKNCCRYGSCENGDTLSDGYCRHHQKCNYCSERQWVENGRCRDHRCGECGVPVSSGGYCSNHIERCLHCSKRISEYNERCDGCAQKYKCQYSYCSVIVYPSEWSYCIDHKYGCQVGSSCSERLRNYGEYCEDHKKECEFDKCDKRISNYSNHCPQHPPQEQARLYKEERNQERSEKNQEKNRADNLQTKFNTKKGEVDWLKERLEESLGNDYQARIEERYPPRFRNND